MDDPIRVLVVDDEPPVIEGLRASIARELDGFEVIGSAGNGREAIELARTLQPDIILLDVQMPGIDGIEALKTMRQHGVRSIAILVTAYERFDVARRGYGLGVRDYLVKPIGPSTIRVALEKAGSEIREMRERQAEAVEVAEASTRMLRIVERALLHLVLAGASNSPVVDEIISYLGLDQSKVLPLLVKHDHGMGEAIVERLHFTVDGPVGTIAPGVVLALAFGADGPAEAYVERVEQALTMVTAGNPRVRAGARAPIAHARTSILELTDSESLVPDARLFHLRSTIVRAVRTGDTKLATSALDDYVFIAGEYSAAGAALEALLVTLSDAIGSHRGAVSDIALEAILESRRVGDVESSVQSVRRRILEWIETSAEVDSLSSVVRSAVEIIRNEYEQDLSIEELSDRLEVSASHLSRSFSADVGQPLSGYLADLRIQRATELLETSTLSIKEIAARCGFRDPNYFSRAFRTATGRTPSEFARSRRQDATN